MVTVFDIGQGSLWTTINLEVLLKGMGFVDQLS
jgi:hypothetical protein